VKALAHRGERGSALLVGAVCAACMMGMLGLAVDLGRMYIARNEAQAHVDSAALEAALMLDGTDAGLEAARAAVAGNGNRWHLGNARFEKTRTEFSSSADGPWEAAPPAAEVRFVRVRAEVAPPLYFVPVVSRERRGHVVAAAVAGQTPRTNFREGVLAWACEAPDARDEVHFGLAPGGACALTPMNGEAPGERRRLEDRARQDTDVESPGYAEYEAKGAGNGRRLVLAPVVTAAPQGRVLGYRGFFLPPPGKFADTVEGPVVAEYTGNHTQGRSRRGAGGPGAFVVRLMR
jgi:hypothetical protein